MINDKFSIIDIMLHNSIIYQQRCVIDLTQDDIYQFCLLKQQHWSYSIEEQLKWWHHNSDSDDILLRLTTKNTLLAFLRLRKRFVKTINADTIQCYCITEVCVDARHIRKGIGKLLMNYTAHVLADKLDKPLGYLLCNKDQIKFYTNVGWSHVSNAYIRTNENEKYADLARDTNCFIFDPAHLIEDTIFITGSIF